MSIIDKKNTNSSKNTKYFKELLKEYQDAIREYKIKSIKKNKEKLIALTLVLAQYYYQQNEMQKAKHHLRDILNLDERVENVHLYLGLIALYENNQNLASEEIKKEINLFPENSFAKELEEKIEISINFPYITTLLIVLFLCVMFFLDGKLNLTSLFTYGLNSSNITINNLFSSIFVHSSWIHGISNILILVLFGHILEKYFGSLKFTLIFLFSAILGNLSQAVFFPIESGFVVGASAGMFGILGALLIRSPLLETKVFGFFRVPLIYVLGIIFSISILIPTSLFQSAEVAHLIGLFSGILLAGVFYPQNISIFYNWIFVSFGLFIWTLGISEILVNQSITHIIISIIVSIFGLLLAAFGYNLLEKSFLKRGLKNE